MGEVVLVDLVSVSVDVNGCYYIEEKGRSLQGEMEAPSPSIELDHSQRRHAVEIKRLLVSAVCIPTYLPS